MSIDLGVTKMSRTCRLKFRAKSLHVTLMLIAVVLKPGQLRTDRVTVSCDGGGSVSACRGSMASHREMSWGHRLSACFSPTLSVGWFSF